MSKKGGSQTTTSQVEVPQYIEDAMRSNLDRASQVSQIGYTPYYGPDVAAFSPMQQASFQNTAGTAGAFGMSAPTTQQDIMGGMPAPTQFAGGVQGYSSAPMFEQSVDTFRARRPNQAELMDSFFVSPGSVSGGGGMTKGQAIASAANPTPGASGFGGGSPTPEPAPKPTPTPSERRRSRRRRDRRRAFERRVHGRELS